MDTGDFTIDSVELSDDGYYYYKFYGPDMGDTGVKYEYSLGIYGKFFKSTIHNLKYCQRTK